MIYMNGLKLTTIPIEKAMLWNSEAIDRHLEWVFSIIHTLGTSAPPIPIPTRNLWKSDMMKNIWIEGVKILDGDSGPSEAVRHGGGRRTKNLQGEREKKRRREGRKERE